MNFFSSQQPSQLFLVDEIVKKCGHFIEMTNRTLNERYTKKQMQPVIRALNQYKNEVDALDTLISFVLFNAMNPAVDKDDLQKALTKEYMKSSESVWKSVRFFCYYLQKSPKALLTNVFVAASDLKQLQEINAQLTSTLSASLTTQAQPELLKGVLDHITELRILTRKLQERWVGFAPEDESYSMYQIFAGVLLDDFREILSRNAKHIGEEITADLLRFRDSANNYRDILVVEDPTMTEAWALERKETFARVEEKLEELIELSYNKEYAGDIYQALFQVSMLISQLR